MAKIITFGNQKGGVGKSTLTLLCANALAAVPFSKKILVIDNDQQRSIARLRAFDEEEESFKATYPVRFMSYKEIIKEIEQIDLDYDYVFIDTPGKLDINQSTDQQHITKILMLLDCVFLPFKAGVLNLDATSDYVKILLQIQKQRENTPRKLSIWGMVNGYKTGTRVNKHLDTEIDFLKKHTKVSFMRTKVKQYTAFEDIDTRSSFFEMGNTNDKARLNFSIFFKEFIKILEK